MATDLDPIIDSLWIGLKDNITNDTTRIVDTLWIYYVLNMDVLAIQNLVNARLPPSDELDFYPLIQLLPLSRGRANTIDVLSDNSLFFIEPPAP